MLQDTFDSRTFYVGKVHVQLDVHNTLPLIISKDDRLLREHVMREVDGVVNDVEITDTDMAGRFIKMGGMCSALTQNIALMYYDKKYKDILILPDLSYLTIATIQIPFNLTGYRLGSFTPVRDGDISTMLGKKETTRFDLPEGKNVGKFKSYLLSLTGSGTNNNMACDRFEELINNVWNVNHFSRRPSVLVELGTPQQLFASNDPLHLYLLGQLNVIDFSLFYAGYMNYTGKLYLHFKF